MRVEAGADGPTEAAGNHGESSSGFVLVIDGSTLDWALQKELRTDFLELSCKCKAVICCRSTPLQKSQVVRLVRDQLGVMTLAVGKNPSLLKCSFSHTHAYISMCILIFRSMIFNSYISRYIISCVCHYIYMMLLRSE